MANKLQPLTEEKQYKDVEKLATPPAKTPDEMSGLNIEAKFKISDPETGKVIVEGRA
jgi:hypothetical protein